MLAFFNPAPGVRGGAADLRQLRGVLHQREDDAGRAPTRNYRPRAARPHAQTARCTRPKAPPRHSTRSEEEINVKNIILSAKISKKNASEL